MSTHTVWTAASTLAPGDVLVELKKTVTAVRAVDVTWLHVTFTDGTSRRLGKANAVLVRRAKERY